MISPEYGGTGKGAVYEIIIAEEISAVSPVVDVSCGLTSVYFAPPLHKFGSDELKKKYHIGDTSSCSTSTLHGNSKVCFFQ